MNRKLAKDDNDGKSSVIGAWAWAKIGKVTAAMRMNRYKRIEPLFRKLWFLKTVTYLWDFVLAL